MNNIGYWSNDEAGLPCFEYTGKIPYSAKLRNGSDVKLPNDPCFLLGNYRFTMFTHVSGEYELISGQRSWARINQGKNRNSGVNSSVCQINGKTFSLTGMDSPAADSGKCRRIFGCGFAAYLYDIENISVTRNISVKPSFTPYDGSSAFLLTVKIKNNRGEKISFNYTEIVGVNFEPIQFQTACEYLPFVYKNEFCSLGTDAAAVKISAESGDILLFSDRKAMSKYDGFPPEIFIKSISGNGVVHGDEKSLICDVAFEIKPDEEKTIQLIIGYSFEYGISDMNKITDEVSAGKSSSVISSAFCDDWLKVIPDFPEESDTDIRRELRWHIYNLEAMANYSEYYNETKIPQGTVYDYDWGCHASARDNFQHALPLVYFNPKLAKSSLRYMLKRTTAFGEIRLIESGNGYAENERYSTSDQQLYYFLLLSEYLRVTENYTFLIEKIQPFPARGQQEMTVLEFTEKCFVFLRDTVGTGVHGLVRLLNSDWNDAVYYIEKVPYNNVVLTGESHMNSAMAVSILQTLIPQLSAAAERLPNFSSKINMLCGSMKFYRKNILDAFLNDMSDRAFPRRMYFNGKAYGENNMFLEPMGFTLQINEIDVPSKKMIFNEMKKRLYNGEKLGAREQEAPEFDDEEFDKGSRENGGFWWSLNGPVIVGVSQFDKAEAQKLFENMTLKNMSEKFPEYWSSYWSAADNQESSLIIEEGLPDQSLTYWNIPVYCAHPHAWILYCWYYLNL